MASKFREETGFQETDLSHPWVQQAAMQIFYRMETEYPRLRDDDLEAHLNTLSELTQDETADPIARLPAMKRQDLYFQWQAQMAVAAAPVEQGAGERPAARSGLDPRAIAREMAGGAAKRPAVVATARG